MKQQSPKKLGSPVYEKSNSLQTFDTMRKQSNFSEISQNFGNVSSQNSLLFRNIEKIAEADQRVFIIFG